ncbi:MAG: response regulator [Alphaproteobacteria bacterium]
MRFDTDVKSRDVLLVDDSPGDVMLVREAMGALELSSQLHVVENGVEALRFLAQEDEYADRPRPDMILLDLNMPKMSGTEVLERIKTDPRWKNIPVAVLTTSDSEDDVERCYELSANCYIVKPMDIASFHAVIGAIDAFWLSHVELPVKH